MSTIIGFIPRKMGEISLHISFLDKNFNFNVLHVVRNDMSDDLPGQKILSKSLNRDVLPVGTHRIYLIGKYKNLFTPQDVDIAISRDSSVSNKLREMWNNFCDRLNWNNLKANWDSYPKFISLTHFTTEFTFKNGKTKKVFEPMRGFFLEASTYGSGVLLSDAAISRSRYNVTYHRITGAEHDELVDFCGYKDVLKSSEDSFMKYDDSRIEDIISYPILLE